MKYILDTHTLLWLIFDSNKLSPVAEKIILNKMFRKCVSISSLWEIAIKNRIGKLPLPEGLNSIYAELKQNGFGVVGIYRSHVEAFNALPLIHRDPFDGIIIATAIAENMIIVTADEDIQKYNVSLIW